jgi:hypothetical protein
MSCVSAMAGKDENFRVAWEEDNLLECFICPAYPLSSCPSPLVLFLVLVCLPTLFYRSHKLYKQ